MPETHAKKKKVNPMKNGKFFIVNLNKFGF